MISLCAQIKVRIKCSVWTPVGLSKPGFPALQSTLLKIKITFEFNVEFSRVCIRTGKRKVTSIGIEGLKKGL